MGKRGPSRGGEGAQFLRGDIYTLTLVVAGTLATGDGQAWVDVPFPSEVVEAFMSLKDKGGTSGSTKINIRNATDSQDLFAAANQPEIAYNATNAYLKKASSTMQNHTSLDTGDVLGLDIDAVPGTASAGLQVTLVLRRL